MKKVNVFMSLPAVRVRGIQDGPDLTKWGIIVALALTFVSIATAGIETSPDGTDPLGVKGAIYQNEYELHGKMTTQSTSIDECSPSACYRTCDSAITSPYCFVANATCVGDTDCTCTWFCGQSGGVQHEPREPWTCPTMQENGDSSN